MTDDVVYFTNGTSATRGDLEKTWDEIDDTTFLPGWTHGPGGIEKWDVGQDQIDHYTKAVILTCVDQLEASLEDNSGHKVHHWEVDGILRAIDILEMMVEGISATEERASSQISQDQKQASE